MNMISSSVALMLGSSVIIGMVSGENPILTTCTPGVYAVTDHDALLALPRTKADHRKLTGMLGAMLLGPVGGNKMKIKTVLPGASATIGLNVARPVFRFCFAPSIAATGDSSDYVGMSANGMSPRDYQLVRFEQVKDQRELVLSGTGSFGGPQEEISKSAVAFKAEEISPGQFRVTPSHDLEIGQYGFLHAVSAPASTRKKDVQEQVYDFAVTR